MANCKTCGKFLDVSVITECNECTLKRVVDLYPSKNKVNNIGKLHYAKEHEGFRTKVIQILEEILKCVGGREQVEIDIESGQKYITRASLDKAKQLLQELKNENKDPA